MKLPLLLLPLLLLTACIEDELTFTVEASPVKADIVRLSEAAAPELVYSGTFTELDKDGILDSDVGIVASPVVNLELRVFSQRQELLATLVTDEQGKTTLSLPVSQLQGVSRLEWAGTYRDADFRILTDL